MLKQPKFFDLTPTWSAAVPVLVAALQNGTSTGKEMAMEELKRMARYADLYVKQVQSKEGGV